MLRPIPITEGEIDVLSPGIKMTVSEWASQRRVLSSKVSKYHGNYDHSIAPFNAEIMDALSDSTTREVWDSSCAQGGKSTIAENFLGRVIECAPGPFGIFLPGEDAAKKRLRTRLKPMFEVTESLRKHLYKGRLNNLNVGQETILDNMIMYIGWASSAITTSDITLKYAVLDEVGKFETSAGAESSPVDQIRDRLTTYSNESKLYGASTRVNVGDPFDVEFSFTDDRQWWVKCPHCGQRHIANWQHVHLEKHTDGSLLSPNDYERGGIECSWYFCMECGTKWTEQDRFLAVSAGRWAPAGCTVTPDGRIEGKVFSNPRRGYTKTAFMLYPGFFTIHKLASEWAAAQVAKHKGNIEPLKKLIRSRFAESWEEKVQTVDENILALHVGNYPKETVPEGVQMLTAGFDVQVDHVWVTLTGWGYGAEGWIIGADRLETGDTSQLENFNIVKLFLRKNWPMSKDRQIAIYASGIDSNYRADVVKDLCIQCANEGIILLPVRGEDRVRSKMYHTIKMEGTGLNRYDLNVTALKDSLYYQLCVNQQPGIGYMHLPAGDNETLISHLSSEEKKSIIIKGKADRKRWWPKGKSHKRANHLWDGLVYSKAAAEISGVRFLEPLIEKPPPKQKRPKKSGGGFLDSLNIGDIL